jgi:predicted RNA-binding Zn-ribbon protein involved in translation (DUF1610 family)
MLYKNLRAMKTCISCGSLVKDYVEFPCPSCGEKIVRCSHCREISNIYVCKKCGFEGP